MPAIAPPDNPLLCPALGRALEVEFADPVLVAFGKMLPRDVVTGNFTSVQRVSVCEKTQHESVEFGELAAQ
jgi:hypothetical protein